VNPWTAVDVHFFRKGRTAAVADANELDALKALYEDRRRESQRLRDARASVTRQLGPLPISAAIVAGLITGFAPAGADLRSWALIAAGILSALLVLASIVYNNMRPYRELRSKYEKEIPLLRHPSQITGDLSRLGGKAQVAWHRAMIDLEERVYGSPRKKWWERRLPSRDVDSLQEGFDRERTGLIAVQALFAFVIVFLVLARVA
jgi:hypothetical protein